MENTRLFFQFLHKFIELSEEEFDTVIKPYLEIRSFKKKQVITQVGEVEEYMNFVVKGLVRKYYQKEKDEINQKIEKLNKGTVLHQSNWNSRGHSEFTFIMYI